ncbi:hypothetical protein PM082_006664 [Marasmius tenuissimus]|nr:hypothetical protein PM082_006664 [Marasmius tenuissimus]
MSVKAIFGSRKQHITLWIQAEPETKSPRLARDQPGKLAAGKKQFMRMQKPLSIYELVFQNLLRHMGGSQKWHVNSIAFQCAFVKRGMI